MEYSQTYIERQNQTAQKLKDQFTEFYMEILQKNAEQLASLGLDGITSSTPIAEGKDAQTFYAEDIFTIIFGQRERAVKVVKLIDMYFEDKDEETLAEVKDWFAIEFVKNRFFIAQEVSSQMSEVLKDVVERVDLFVNVTSWLATLLECENIYNHMKELSQRPKVNLAGMKKTMTQDDIDALIAQMRGEAVSIAVAA